MIIMIAAYSALAVLGLGLIVQWAAIHFLGEDRGKIAGFAGTIGVLLGNIAADSRPTPQWMGLFLGGALGLIVLWWFLFRRKAFNG